MINIKTSPLGKYGGQKCIRHTESSTLPESKTSQARADSTVKLHNAHDAHEHDGVLRLSYRLSLQRERAGFAGVPALESKGLHAKVGHYHLINRKTSRTF